MCQVLLTVGKGFEMQLLRRPNSLCKGNINIYIRITLHDGQVRVDIVYDCRFWRC